MKIKILSTLLAVSLLLASCGSGSDNSGQSWVSVPAPDEGSSQVSTPAGTDNSSAVSGGDESSLPADSSETDVSTENNSSSAPEVSQIPAGPDDVTYSGQCMSTHGMDKDVLSDYLEGALFVGDSLTDGFKIYVGNNYGNMPSVNFFSGSSYGYQNACRDKESTSVHPKIGGEAKYIWEAVEHYGAKRVFINFGLNDFGYVSDNKLKTCLDTICNNIKEVSPDTEIIFMSCGFFTKSGQTTSYGYSNDKVREKNEVVLNYCKANGYDYLDVSWAYADSEGNLISDYSHDNYCHLKYNKYNYWEDILMAYAADKLLNQFENIDTMLK